MYTYNTCVAQSRMELRDKVVDSCTLSAQHFKVLAIDHKCLKFLMMVYEPKCHFYNRYCADSVGVVTRFVLNN